MEQQNLGRLLIKVLGIIVIAYALIGLPQNVVTVIGMLSLGRSTGVPRLTEAIEMPQFWGQILIPFIVYLAMGLWLFWWGGRTVDRVAARDKNEIIPSALHGLDELAVFILGLYFFAEGIVDITRWTTTEFAYDASSHSQFGSSVWVGNFGTLGSGGMRLLIGVFLTFGCRIVAALRRHPLH
jgi:hypothetical protein